MKKILAALAVLSTLALSGCDNGASVSAGNGKSEKIVCRGGYAFAYIVGAYNVSMAQIWENGPNGPRPMMCGGKEKE